MNKEQLLKKLKGKLIVSCQALPGEPLYIENGTIMHLMAIAAEQAGAAGIRTNGIRDIEEIKKNLFIKQLFQTSRLFSLTKKS